MLHGREVALRARIESDVPILHSGLYEDVDMHSNSDGRAWRPMTHAAEGSPYKVRESSTDVAVFTAVALVDGRVLGDAVLWRIDLHNRAAHIGLALLPEARGRGVGLDVTEVLCRYAFRTLGLHRLQIETTADNAAMLAVSAHAGFTVEGTLRDAGWVNGRFVDEIVLGLLAEDCTAAHPEST
jgi:RimJ/RimL family protein N-acetyltransferase